MKKKKIQVIVLSIIAVAIIVYLIYRSSSPSLNSDTVAIVNGAPIKLRDFEDRLSSIKMTSPPDKSINLASLKNTLVRRMIIETLIIQEAEENNIKVTNDELDRYINNIKKNYTPEEFNQLLLSQFKTYEDWVAEVRNSMLVEKTLSKETIERIHVPDQEIKERYDKNYAGKTREAKIKLAQIFTRSKETAEKALNEIKSGVPFADVAKKYSESPEAEQGGVIGLVAKGSGIEAFDKAFNIKPSETSQIVQSDYGFHIFSVLEYIPPAEVTYEEAKSFIANEIAHEKEAKYYEDWLSNKLKSVKILKNSALIDSVK